VPTTPVVAPFAGTVLRVAVGPDDRVHVGQSLLIIESMKMEHEVVAVHSGIVRRVLVGPGDAVAATAVLLEVEEGVVSPPEADVAEALSPTTVRPELAELRARVANTLDAGRTQAAARRHAGGRRTARQNVADLCDPGSFEEYGALVIAAQRARRDLSDLIANTPADGLISGIGRINGDNFDDAHSRAAVLSYDYSVLAGTQGQMNHRKKDRLFALIERLRLPVVLFAEGGGGRPGDTDTAVVTGLDTEAFALFGGLSGLVPLVGIVSGRCFAGNAALLGCCDVIIATPDANIGMGGPAMIEGGGLGNFLPEEIGPRHVQALNGVVDVEADDEADAVRLAKLYLSYFQGQLGQWSCADQELLRDCIPEDRRRAYDVHAVLDLLDH
jgi:acetyl-CoA carboxylase carboxyltransferase component